MKEQWRITGKNLIIKIILVQSNTAQPSLSVVLWVSNCKKLYETAKNIIESSWVEQNLEILASSVGDKWNLVILYSVEFLTRLLLKTSWPKKWKILIFSIMIMK